MINNRTVRYKINKLLMRGQAGHLRVLGQELLKDRTRAFDANIVGIDYQYNLHRDSHEQRYGRFIYFDLILQGNSEDS